MVELSAAYRVRNVQNNAFLSMTLTGTKTAIVCAAAAEAQGGESVWYLLPHAGPNYRYKLKNIEYGFEAQCDTRSGQLYGATNGHPWIFERLELNNSSYYYIHVGYNSLVVDPGPEESQKISNVRVMANRRLQLQLWSQEEVRNPGQGTGPGKGDGSQRSNPPLLTCYSVTPGIYVLKSVQTGTVIHLEGGTNRIFGHQENGSANQKWYIYPTDIGTNLWIYSAVNTGLAGFPHFGLGAILESPLKTGGYTITPADRGFYISPVESPYDVVDLARRDGRDGTVICLWNKHNGDNQKWYLEPA